MSEEEILASISLETKADFLKHPELAGADNIRRQAALRLFMPRIPVDGLPKLIRTVRGFQVIAPRQRCGRLQFLRRRKKGNI